MDIEPDVAAHIADRDLVLHFESLGDNCELGLVQRMVGAEPLGLLRFAGAPLRNLIRALDARFQNIADPTHIRLSPEHGEYMVKLSKYDFTYHADAKIGSIEPDALLKQQCRTVGYLTNKLIGDLEDPSKILVFRQNEPLLAADLVDLRSALSAYGPNILLWIQEARPGHPPGSVDRIDDSLITGYVRRLAVRNNVPDLDLDSWMMVLRKAYGIAAPAGIGRNPHGRTQPRRDHATSELIFGIEGNATDRLLSGWSGPEPGYIWAVGERSVISIDIPGDAHEYWLEMDVTPFLSPPLLPRQRLDVSIGGKLLRSFEPVPRGEIGCVVPSTLVAGKSAVEVQLDHPHAASPLLILGQGDDRRLGVAFHRMALVCA
jgi:hypothetical protein